MGMYYVVDRRKEMIKYKGFSIAPAEVESVMLEHPGVRDCGVVSRTDVAGEEIPCAFVVLREGELSNRGRRPQNAAGFRRRTADPLQDAARDLFRAHACRAPRPARFCAASCASGCRRSTDSEHRCGTRRPSI